MGCASYAHRVPDKGPPAHGVEPRRTATFAPAGAAPPSTRPCAARALRLALKLHPPLPPRVAYVEGRHIGKAQAKACARLVVARHKTELGSRQGDGGGILKRIDEAGGIACTANIRHRSRISVRQMGLAGASFGRAAKQGGP